MDRNERIIRLYDGGKTLSEIGRLYGLTRERIRQIVARENVPRRGVGGGDPNRAVLHLCAEIGCRNEAAPRSPRCPSCAERHLADVTRPDCELCGGKRRHPYSTHLGLRLCSGCRSWLLYHGSAKRRAAAALANRRWAERNPEKKREINRRAKRAYRDRQKALRNSSRS